MQRIAMFKNKAILSVSFFAFLGICFRPSLGVFLFPAAVALCVLIWILKRPSVYEFDFSSSPSLFSIVMIVILCYDFYRAWIKIETIQTIAGTLGIDPSMILFPIILIGFVVAIPFMIVSFNSVYYRMISLDEFKVLKELRKPFIVVSAITIFSMVAIFRADFNYYDDMGRVVQGGPTWDDFSRYGSGFISRFLHGDTYLSDVSPFPQILAAIITAVSGVLVAYICTKKTRFGLWEYISIIPMCISPYYLQCLSYKYDSPYMALSLLFSVVPFLFKDVDVKYYSCISVLMLLMMCMTYQASSGIYIVLVLLLAFKDWNNSDKPIKDVVKWIMVSAANFIFAMIIFKIINTIFGNGYRSVEMFALGEMPLGVLKNIRTLFIQLYSDFSFLWLMCIALVFVGYIVIMGRASKRQKAMATILACVVVLFAIPFSMGAYLLLKDFPTMPRTLYSIFVLVSVLLLDATMYKLNVSKVAGLILGVCFIIFSFSYGNALSNQARYTDYRVSMVASALSELDCVQSNDPVYIQIKGTIGYAKAVDNMSNSNIIKRLVPITFREINYHGYSGLINYYGLDNLIPEYDANYSQFDLETVEDNAYYTLQVYEQYVLISLK